MGFDFWWEKILFYFCKHIQSESRALTAYSLVANLQLELRLRIHEAIPP
jgi:hypothetical protein